MKIKKLFSLFLATAIFTLLCSSQALAANALQNSGTTVDTPYEYPVVPGTSEWYELTSLEDKIAICHVDEELLVSMTTPALLETIRFLLISMHLILPKRASNLFLSILAELRFYLIAQTLLSV